MEATIEVTTSDLRMMVDRLVEEKIIDMFGDPESDLELRDDLKERLLRQQADLKNGVAKTYSYEEVMAKLGLD